QVAVTVEDQHVLVEGAGGESVDGRQAADGFSGEGRNRHQREGEHDQRDQDEGAPSLGLSLTLPEQPKPAVEEIAGTAAARHQAQPGELDPVQSSIMKYDSEYVGYGVKIEISRRVDG